MTQKPKKRAPSKQKKTKTLEEKPREELTVETEKPPEAETPPFPIVGIGASAGGKCP